MDVRSIQVKITNMETSGDRGRRLFVVIGEQSHMVDPGQVVYIELNEQMQIAALSTGMAPESEMEPPELEPIPEPVISPENDIGGGIGDGPDVEGSLGAELNETTGMMEPVIEPDDGLDVGSDTVSVTNTDNSSETKKDDSDPHVMSELNETDTDIADADDANGGKRENSE